MGNEFEIKDLPLMPQVASKILQMQEENLEISFKELEQIILLDPALTAKILKVANSALYARKKEITNLQQAITLLGFKMIKSLVLLVSASSMYSRNKIISKMEQAGHNTKYAPSSLWSHSVLTAFIAKYLAAKLDKNDLKENIFIAGLIHDIGRNVFILNDAGRYEKFYKSITVTPGKNVLDIEKEVFGYDHQEVGKIVLNGWNFPDEYIDVVSQHHTVDIESKYKVMVEIVGLANIYAGIFMGSSLPGYYISLKDQFCNDLNLSREDDQYIESNLMKDLEEDELFSMSINLVASI